MNHNVFRQLGIRLAFMVGIFLILTLVIYFTGLPQPWVWASMATLFLWKTVMSKML